MLALATMMIWPPMRSVRQLLPVLFSSSLSNSHHHHQRWAMISRAWDPLPSRRSRASLTAVEAHDEHDNENAQQASSRGTKPDPAGATTKVRLRNRPGFNSYLKVDMPDEVLQNLRQIIQTVASDYDREFIQLQAPTTDEAKSSTIVIAANKRSGRIKPRSVESLHMTLFFGGETLGQVGKEHLEDLHQRFTSVIQGSGFVTTSAANSTGPSAGDPMVDDSSSPAAAHRLISCHSDDDFWFTIQEVRVFPPGRNNLIVAILEAAPAWHTLRSDLREAARAVESDEIRTVLSDSHETWVAHITLANLSSPKKPKKQSIQLLQQTLRDVQLALSDDQRRIFAKGISMGGPMPTQVDLNWNFPFRGK
jgi:2'-5' RNA ligase